jgi:hypothetical protein
MFWLNHDAPASARRERETDKDNHGAMKPEFQFCASHIPPLKIYGLMLPEALVTR